MNKKIKIFCFLFFVFILSMRGFSACVNDGLGNIICDTASGSETGVALTGESLTKIGIGETVLDGNNSFSAVNPANSHITVNDGTLSVASPSTLTGNFTLKLNGGNFKTSGDMGFANNILFGGGNLLIDSDTLTLSGILNGNINKSGLGTLALESSNIYTDTLNINDGSVTANINSFNGSAVLSGSSTLLTLENNTDSTLSGNITGSGTLSKTGSGALTLAGANTAALDIQNGSVVISSANNAQGEIKLNGGILSTVGDISLANKIIFNSATLNIAEDENLTLTGQLSGAGFSKNGLGVLIIEKDSPLISAYQGAIAVSNGGIFTNAGSFNGSAVLADEDTFIVFKEDTNAYFDGSVSGDGTFIKEGAAYLELTGTNNVATTDITEGAISISSAANIQGDIKLSGGELLATNDITLGNGINQNIRFDSSSKGFNVAAGKTLTLGNGVKLESGSCDEFNNCAVLVKDGSGTLVLNQDTSGGRYAGDTLIRQGVLQISNGNQLGNNTTEIFINNAALKITDNATIDNKLNFLTSNSVLDITGTALLDANTVGGGTLVKEGSGTLVFNSGIMAHVNGTVINSGTVQGTTSNLAGNIQINSGTFLSFSQDSDGASNTVLSGGGTVNKYGNGIVTLANANTFTGLFNVEEGALRGNNKSFSSNINIADGASVIFNHTCSNAADCLTFNGEFNKTISGDGALIKEGNAELYLKAANSYTGGTYLRSSVRDEGGIYFTDEAALGTGNISISNSNLTVGGDMNLAREIIFGSGVNSLTVKDGGSFEINSLLSGTSFLKLGEGELVLNNDNDLENGVMISNGTLTIARESALGSGMLSLNGDGTLRITESFNTDKLINVAGNAGFKVDSGKTLGLDYALYGGGTIVKKGMGTLELNYLNQYTGGIRVEEGLLKGNANSILGHIYINSGAGLEFNQDYNDYYTGDINSQGTITKNGAGILLMQGDSENLNLLSIGNLDVNNGGIILASKFEGNANIAQDAFLSLESDAKGSFESYGNFYIDNKQDIDIEGDITIKNGGSLNLFINEGRSTQINVKQDSSLNGGNITIDDGGKVEISANGVFASPQTFDFINYDGAFTGNMNNFDITVINNKRLLAALNNDGDSLSFTITRLLSQNARLGGLNASQRSIAYALDILSAAPSTDMETVLNAVDAASAANNHSKAITQLGGFIYANLPNTFSRFKSNAYLRINRNPAEDNSFKKNLWVQAVNNFSDIKATDTSSDLYLLSNGFSVGLDKYYDEFGLTAGFFAGYARHDLVHNKTEDLDGDEYQLGVYGLKQGDIFDFKGALSLGYQADDIERDIPFLARQALARIKTYGVNLDFEAGMQINSLGIFTIRPFAGITTYTNKNASFSETGAGAADLSSNGNITFSAEGRIGLGLQKKANSFSYYADTFVKQRLNTPNTKLSIAGEEYKVESADIGTVFGIAAGVVRSFSDSLSIYGNGGIDMNGTMQKYYLNFGFRTYW